MLQVNQIVLIHCVYQDSIVQNVRKWPNFYIDFFMSKSGIIFLFKHTDKKVRKNLGLRNSDRIAKISTRVVIRSSTNTVHSISGIFASKDKFWVKLAHISAFWERFICWEKKVFSPFSRASAGIPTGWEKNWQGL